MELILSDNFYWKVIYRGVEAVRFTYSESLNDISINFLKVDLVYFDRVLIFLMNRLRDKMYRNLNISVFNFGGLKKFLGIFLHKDLVSLVEDGERLQICLLLNRCSGRNVKVIPIWLGPRRKWSGDYMSNVFDLVKFIMYKELELDKGIVCDTRLVINNPYDVGVFERTKWLRDFVYNFDGCSSFNGRIHVEERENRGISYGGFAYMYEKYRMDYDFWFFNEDDYIIDKVGYMLSDFNQFRRLECNIGYISESDVCRNYPLSEYPTHVNFGLGLTSRVVLDRVGSLSYLSVSRDGAESHELYGEIPFTNEIYKLGYDLVLSENYGSTIEWMGKWEGASKMVSFSEGMRGIGVSGCGGGKIFI